LNPATAVLPLLPELAAHFDPSQPLLLMVGGSQGAEFFNGSIQYLMNEADLLQAQVLLITGRSQWEAFSQRMKFQTPILDVRKNGLHVLALPYISAMGSILPHCRMFVGRAGASTLTEMAAAGIPGLVLPYPHATDGHQEANAQHYARGGAVRVLSQKGLHPGKFWREIADLWSDDEELARMAAKMRQFSDRQAAERVLECIRAVSVHGTYSQ
jgi:UDP-N-acetylglucosamine--N-acetylmuramyl-(pentapeptide) pyrophosphoryl-undecaprenol N-acetylglucosamine transferase